MCTCIELCQELAPGDYQGLQVTGPQAGPRLEAPGGPVLWLKAECPLLQNDLLPEKVSVSFIQPSTDRMRSTLIREGNLLSALLIVCQFTS